MIDESNICIKFYLQEEATVSQVLDVCDAAETLGSIMIDRAGQCSSYDNIMVVECRGVEAADLPILLTSDQDVDSDLDVLRDHSVIAYITMGVEVDD